MISLMEFKKHLLAGISDDIKVELISAKQNETLRRCFKNAIEDISFDVMLNKLLDSINKLKDSDQFLKLVSNQVKETVRPSINNELTAMLGDFFEPDPGCALDEEDLKEQFKVNLITQMNVILVAQIGIESEIKAKKIKSRM